ncbi:MAG: DUF4474 domain-containing protein [Oscillospiraceae bacterium]|nr:DUF4474 domain-containing protein [Oscillospiraceae bacterium]
MGVNKVTVAVVSLVAVCVASLVAVKQLTKSQQIDNPVIVVSTEAPTAGPVSESTSQPATTQPSTSEPTSDSLFTTYDVNATSTTTPTTTTPTTTTKPTAVTTAKPVTTTKASAATTDKNIQNAAKTSSGFLSYLFNKDGNYYYTESDPWQRHFGFNKAYDFGAQFVFMFYDTARIYFEYNNKDWLVQLWKGQYGGVFIGAEIGVYTKPKDRKVEHYDCASDSEALKMEMTFYRNGEELLTRDYGTYWWCTGFVPGKLKKYSDRSELSIKTRITMKDKTMRKAFLNGMKNCEEFEFIEDVNYSVDGLDVFINW